MPSNKYIDLTLGATDDDYTAPANGWFVIGKKSSASGQYLNVQIDNAYFFSSNAYTNTTVICTHVPVLKGKVIKINYTLGGDTQVFRFIYAQGEL